MRLTKCHACGEFRVVVTRRIREGEPYVADFVRQHGTCPGGGRRVTTARTEGTPGPRMTSPAPDHCCQCEIEATTEEASR